MGMKKKMRKVWESLGVGIKLINNCKFSTILMKLMYEKINEKRRLTSLEISAQWEGRKSRNRRKFETAMRIYC